MNTVNPTEYWIYTLQLTQFSLAVVIKKKKRKKSPLYLQKKSINLLLKKVLTAKIQFHPCTGNRKSHNNTGRSGMEDAATPHQQLAS